MDEVLSKPLTIVQVLPALQSGGVERGTLEVGKYLVQQGHRSIVISAGGRLVTQLLAEGSEHINWPIGQKTLFTLRLIPRLIRFFQQQQVDIVHVRSRFPAWICYFALKIMPAAKRPQLITTFHGAYSVSAYSAIMAKGEQVIVVSNMIKDYVQKHYPINPEKLHLNYRGVDDKIFAYHYKPPKEWLEKWYADFPETRDKQIILLPGRVSRWKGQSDFIELLAQLKNQESAMHGLFHGLIVGETKPDKISFLNELKQNATKLGVNDCLTFIDHRADLKELMAISSVVLSLSHEPEAFGRTTLEALSLGTPVVGYAHGGVGEQLALILPDGCVTPNNINQAARRTLKWLKTPPVVPNTNIFSLQKMLNTTLNIYKNTVFNKVILSKR